MTDLYEQRIDAMRAKEHLQWDQYYMADIAQYECNIDRLAAYKRKRVWRDIREVYESGGGVVFIPAGTYCLLDKHDT